MRLIHYVVSVGAACLFIQCAGLAGDHEKEETRTQGEALCVAEWNPTWRQGSGANEWWVEYEITGGTVASAFLEIPGVRNITLTNHSGKWAASPGSTKVASGTQVILHATTTAGADAQSVPFSYLVQTAPASDPCTSGTDAGGTDSGATDGGGTDSGATDAGGTDAGACDSSFSPTFQQGSGANDWWVEYTISTTTVKSATFQVAGGQTIPLTLSGGKWHGKPTAAVPSGTSVVVKAESTSGEHAETVSFRYLVDTHPATKACSTDGGTPPPDAGTDAGTDGGPPPTCSSFSPTWQQGSGANTWWVEYSITGPVRSAQFVVAGGQTIELTHDGKWHGKPTAAIPSGTSVVLEAESTNGELAETLPFRYLVDHTPVTAPCDTGFGNGAEIYGVTIDSTRGPADTVEALRRLPHKPTARVVFDEFVPATEYVVPLEKYKTVSWIMGEILDSAYVEIYSTAEYLDRVDEYLRVLDGRVDLWEVGNEINGEWLGDTATVVAKVSGAYDKVKAAGKKTELTLYYNAGCFERGRPRDVPVDAGQHPRPHEDRARLRPHQLLRGRLQRPPARLARGLHAARTRYSRIRISALASVARRRRIRRRATSLAITKWRSTCLVTSADISGGTSATTWSRTRTRSGRRSSTRCSERVGLPPPIMRAGEGRDKILIGVFTGPLTTLLLEGALATVAALLAPRAKTVAFALGVVGLLGAPWLAGPIPLARGLITLIGGILLLRVIDLVRIGDSWSSWRRLAHVVSFVDSRTLRRATPALDLRAHGRALLWAALGAAAFYVARSPALPVRWAAGLVFAYSAVEAGYAFTGATYRAIGFVAPRLHVLPLASLTIGELWGMRWARPISTWLRETCFRPLARRGYPTLGLLIGFLASAFGHAYGVLVAIGLPMAAMMFGFFMLQGVFVLIEGWLGTSRWPRRARRAWTVTIMLASSPLFVEPALRVLG